MQCGLLHCVTSLRLLLTLNKKGKHALQCKNIIQIMFYHIIIPLKKINNNIYFTKFSSVQFSRSVWLFVTPWIAARQASLSITNSLSPPKLMSIESVMPSSYLILCHPLLLLPPIPPPPGSFPMSQLSASGSQSIGVPASASVLPMYTQDWLLLGWTGWISIFSWKKKSLWLTYGWCSI